MSYFLNSTTCPNHGDEGSILTLEPRPRKTPSSQLNVSQRSVREGQRQRASRVVCCVRQFEMQPQLRLTQTISSRPSPAAVVDQIAHSSRQNPTSTARAVPFCASLLPTQHRESTAYGKRRPRLRGVVESAPTYTQAVTTRHTHTTHLEFLSVQPRGDRLHVLGSSLLLSGTDSHRDFSVGAV